MFENKKVRHLNGLEFHEKKEWKAFANSSKNFETDKDNFKIYALNKAEKYGNAYTERERGI